MKVVTSGSAFVDIDAYAGCIAYAELLQKQGESAQAVSTAPINDSVTPSLHALDVPFATSYSPGAGDEFVLIDVSNPAFFDTFVDPEKVTGVIDHHTGFEKYWHNRIGEEARIEFIGAACTLVYERWQAAQRLGEMSTASAQLLAAGIVDNTLDFKIGITTDRDRTAYQALLKQANLPDDWKTVYFREYQQAVEADILKALRTDFKTLPESAELPRVIGQIVIWEGPAEDFIAAHRSEMAEVFEAGSPEWCMNVISIAEEKSYLVSPHPIVQQKLSKALGVKFENGQDVVALDHLILRKQIIKAATRTSS